MFGAIDASLASASAMWWLAGALVAGGLAWFSRSRGRGISAPRDDAPSTDPQTAAPKGGTIRAGLGRTRDEGFVARLSALFAGGDLAPTVLDEVEEILFTADIGVKTAGALFERIRAELGAKGLTDVDRVWAAIREEALAILKRGEDEDRSVPTGPGETRVILVLGVNGSGKTTTIGKLASQWVERGQKVWLVAGDTFRAAAAEQLEHWGRRVGAEVTRGKEGADPASVVFDGVREAVAAQADVVLVDTAGRLHTQVNLMAELEKVHRVTGRALEGAPHETLLVVDATTGQNAIQQAQKFHAATNITGVVLTKLDGTAKGGIVLGVCESISVPIRHIGVGERVADLRAFDRTAFVDALFSA
jgi:fused signal recognition particle receptor